MLEPLIAICVMFLEAHMTNQVEKLKSAIATIWQLENELRYSAWSALTLDKDQAQRHLSQARTHLNNILNAEDPIGHTVDQPPVINPENR